MVIDEQKHKFCMRIHFLRLQQKLSLCDLSEQSGVPLSMLEQIESGHLPPDLMLDQAADLADVLGCQVYELF